MAEEEIVSPPEGGNDGRVESLETLTLGQKEFLAEAEKRSVPRELFGKYVPETTFGKDPPDTTKPTVALINTGGTLMMVPSRKNPSALSFHDAVSVPRVVEIMDIIYDVQRKMNIVGIDLGNMDSKEVNPRVWQAMAATIKAVYDRVSGVVICHGTNTLEYSGPAVAYALQKLAMPIVLTASQIPILGHMGSDGLSNLSGALEVAAYGDLAEVAVYAHGEIHRATRVAKVHDSRLRFLESKTIGGPIGHKTAGCGRNGIKLMPGAKKTGTTRKHELVFLPVFDSHVIAIPLLPGITGEMILGMYDNSRAKGIIIETSGSGAFSVELLPAIKKLIERGVPVFLSSSCGESGISNEMQGHDEDALAAYGAGVRNVGDMSTSAAAVKLMHVFAHVLRGSRDDIQEWRRKIKEEMIRKSYAGEITLQDERDPY